VGEGACEGARDRGRDVAWREKFLSWVQAPGGCIAEGMVIGDGVNGAVVYVLQDILAFERAVLLDDRAASRQRP
jgi:hypothetical protein